MPGRRDVEDDGDSRLEERRVDGRRGRRRGGRGGAVVEVVGVAMASFVVGVGGVAM